MSFARTQGALRQYSQIATGTGVEGASPHRLIQMLLDGALEKIAVAKGHVSRSEYIEKGRHISWAISIIAGLRASLDINQGGEIAANLEALYDYMERRLLDANSRNDLAALDEVAGLLRQVKDAWDAIPQTARGDSSVPAAGKNSAVAS